MKKGHVDSNVGSMSYVEKYEVYLRVPAFARVAKA
jgi:hypothetical protein